MEHIDPKCINFASILEEKTRDQAIMTSRMPFIYPHMAVMPDAHLGKGCNVGAVIPTDKAIIPAAVGVDIGCGMMAVETQWSEDEFRAFGALSSLRKDIEARIPVSVGQYNQELYADHTASRMRDLEVRAELAGFRPDSYAPNWHLQLGTLGSGNHFIEVSVDERDKVWLFLHSGSRGIGNRIAVRHIKSAQEQMAKYWVQLPSPDLAYLVEGTEEFTRYIAELRWAQHFALLNRAEMMDRVMASVHQFTGHSVDKQQVVSCHHNYTAREWHFGKEVWLSRKGAIDASPGTMGLIPGSMGTRSYVVRGLGNPMSLNSAPHGAGREYSRSAARRTFTGAQLAEAMEGIEYRQTDAFIDEIPAAYKDIDVVMADASSLVEVVHTLRQIINVKGD